jgi:hypothetical protein
MSVSDYTKSYYEEVGAVARGIDQAQAKRQIRGGLSQSLLNCQRGTRIDRPLPRLLQQPQTPFEP